MIELYTCKMRRLNQLNATGYHLMQLVESSTGQVEYIRLETLH